MEKQEPQYGTYEYNCVLADKLEALNPNEQYGGSIPKVVTIIISLLREDRLQNAIDTYVWEADKLSYHKEIIEILDKELKEPL